MSIEIQIADTQDHLKIDHDAPGARLARSVLIAEDRTNASVSIALVDDSTIHQLNRLHLKHDCPTDVITFPLSDTSDPVLSGELVVSAEMAAAVARELAADPHQELALYVVHGLLHLCGHDDSSEELSAAMSSRQGELLSSLRCQLRPALE